MDCNRDEALRAKEIAEQKFTLKDIAGAKKFALKALALFPELEGISQMIATLDVYLSAEVKINGESDWYSILCVNALADDETVKKQYRKLALQLHPDKNKSIGAEGAFKFISEAWSVLSDKTRKMAYDQKRKTKTVQQRASHRKKDNACPNSANGFFNFAENTTNVKTQKPPSSRPSNPTTFWTSCNRCRMQYEYLRVYLNHNLLCPNCHEAFLAIETGFPVKGPGSSVPKATAPLGRQKSNHNSTMNNAYGHGKDHSTVQGVGNVSFEHGANVDSYSNANMQWSAFSRTAGAASAAASSSAAVQAASMVHQTYEKVRREREEAQTMARKEEALRRKHRVLKRMGVTINVPDQEQSIPKVDRPAKRSKGIGEDPGTYFGGNDTVPSAEQCANSNMVYGKARAWQNNLSRVFAQIDIRSLLAEKGKVAISKKLEEWGSVAAAAKPAEKEKAKQRPKHKDIEVDGVASDQIKLDGLKNNNKRSPIKKNPSNNLVDSDKEAVPPISIDVPDPDFHDFDKDRSEGSFEGDQVWATYDNEDGMPRFYAFVQKVISLKPFKIRMSFLNSKSNSELGPLNWVASGFAKTCGDFRISKYEINDTVNIFSHRVKWEKGTRGAVKIIPRKGDTWALYRNWSPSWNELTPDDEIYKYDMVEVLEDYNEEQGVLVTPLVKVAGFKTVFHRHMDPKEVKSIPREEMFRFSHQVPSHLLTGEEAHNAPKGCRELDPAATPLDLLQVITEVKDVMEIDEQGRQIS